MKNINKESLERYKNYMEEKKVLSGTVRLVKFNEELNSDILIIILEDGGEVIIKREDIDIRQTKRSLTPYLFKKIEFIIIDIIESGENEVKILASRKEIKEKHKDQLIKKLEEGEEFEAKVVHLEKYGAYLEINEIGVTIRNTEFSDDYTNVSDIYKVNDVIKVKLFKVNSNKRIYVEAVEKYKSNAIIDMDSFTTGSVVIGSVRTIRTDDCFVCIAPNLDVLSPIPTFSDYELVEGDKVSLLIKKVETKQDPNSEKLIYRIKGKIIRILTEDIK
ncbi:TPA: S1 RNA-binding domain-containing protein [Clostridioides difficile]|uniref:S1 RNA-binding domain-containing protein n=1 Tax=Clostridioides difficile TaxID=1496 RepID=A0AAN5VQ68_CLODI|nr:S1 RNA-binding domain-containing protein [Clostridioides difficile]EGT3643710.1 S1 RNA-binding domain-containing protein [Clostridioides difficile]EGT3945497.1 S1 RNA-binding domain-containing protein [Clostridioides difficile]MBG0199001.1 S1 RNA-binding domain-containing protein [Clostridioides difficile]MBH7168910.1 S1 RNA-binding domain-containing protein [Clostridioides difficile]MBH7846014.1 S1 RNA-binding domain-containing protein [Clostridioides difficile]